MKALVLTDVNRLEYRDIPQPVPREKEVLIRVRACGICGSDVQGLDGSTGRRLPPLVMGHEAAGLVAQVGKGVTRWQVGEAVAFDSTIWCGQCRFCNQGKINLCENRQVLGVACKEFRRDGAFAEYVVVPEHVLVKLPEGLSFEEATLAEPLAVALHAVGRLPSLLGQTAFVVGAGMIGLMALQALRLGGCTDILVADQLPERLELAKRLGATQTFCIDRAEQLQEVAAELTRQLDGGTDLVVEAVGLEETVTAAIQTVRKGGAVALIGNLRPEVRLPLQAVVTREISLFGSYASAGEYPLALKLLSQKKVDASALISAVAPLEEGPQWFSRLRAKDPGLLKVILQP